MTQFNGKFKLDTSENFDQFMETLGVNYLIRKAGGAVKPVLTIHTDDGKHFKFTSESTFKTVKVEFNLGEEYDDTSPDGMKTKNVVTLSENKMTQVEKSKDGKGKEVTYIRELTDSGDIKVTCIVDDVVATRHYKKVPK